MTKAEALNLAAQLGLDLPKTKTADALLELCQKLGYDLGLDNVSGDWVVWAASGEELARCA
jgi:hypothetical protein